MVPWPVTTISPFRSRCERCKTEDIAATIMRRNCFGAAEADLCESCANGLAVAMRDSPLNDETIRLNAEDRLMTLRVQAGTVAGLDVIEGLERRKMRHHRALSQFVADFIGPGGASEEVE